VQGPCGRALTRPVVTKTFRFKKCLLDAIVHDAGPGCGLTHEEESVMAESGLVTECGSATPSCRWW
jgi:hypothetical protein